MRPVRAPMHLLFCDAPEKARPESSRQNEPVFSMVVKAMVGESDMQRPDAKFSSTAHATFVRFPVNFACKADHGPERPTAAPMLDEQGLPPGQSFASIRGDPSLHETAPSRNRYVSRMDRKLSLILDTCEWLLTTTDCYSIYIGFNSSEVRTESILHPFSYEIHDADLLVGRDYLSSHFTQMPFAAKMDAIAWVQRRINEGPLQRYRPGTQPGAPNPERRSEILRGGVLRDIVQGLARMRVVDGYYLRNAAISLSQGVARVTFNCDGTYVIPLANFSDFVARNFDSAPPERLWPSRA